MKRSSIITISILTLALPFGCAKSYTAAPATTTQAAPALPGDVQGVGVRLRPRRQPAPRRPPGSSESGGTIVATGELISPVRSELAEFPGRVAKMYVDEDCGSAAVSRCSTSRLIIRVSI